MKVALCTHISVFEHGSNLILVAPFVWRAEYHYLNRPDLLQSYLSCMHGATRISSIIVNVIANMYWQLR